MKTNEGIKAIVLMGRHAPPLPLFVCIRVIRGPPPHSIGLKGFPSGLSAIRGLLSRKIIVEFLANLANIRGHFELGEPGRKP